MAITIINHAVGTPSGGSAATPAIDTTGAACLVAGVIAYGGVPDAISDSKGNAWTRGAVRSVASEAGTQYACLYRCASPTVGPGHTFTAPEASGMAVPTIHVVALAGTAASPFGGESWGATPDDADPSLALDSMTPSEAGAILIALGNLADGGDPIAVDGGFTIADSVAFSTGVRLGSALAHLIQTSAAAAAPTFTCVDDPSQPFRRVGVLAWFKAASGGGPSPLGGSIASSSITASGATLTCTPTGGTGPYSFQWLTSSDAVISGATSAAYSPSGLSAGTSYVYKCRVTDSASAQAVATVSFSTAWAGYTSVAVDDAALYWSEGNAPIVDGKAILNNAGAYCKFRFTGTSASVDVDVSALVSASVAASHYPAIKWRIDGGSWTRFQLTSSSATVGLGSLLAPGTHLMEFHVAAIRYDLDRWNTPLAAVRVSGFRVDSGASVSAAPLRPRKVLLLGDSILEGWEAAAAGLDVANADALLAWGARLAEKLDAEYAIVGFAGQGYTVGVPSANVPSLASAWSYFYSGRSRLAGGQFPAAYDFIVCGHGQNDGNLLPAANVTTLVQAWRAAAPTARIVVACPPNNPDYDDSTSGVAAAGASNAWCVSHGEALLTSPWVSAYPHLNAAGEARYADLLHAAMQARGAIPGAPTLMLSVTISATTSNGLTAVATGTGGTGTKAYAWTLNGQPVAGQSGATLSLVGLAPATSYLVGCTATDSATPPRTATASATATTAVLPAPGGFAYQFLDGAISRVTAEKPLGGGRLTVQYGDRFGVPTPAAPIKVTVYERSTLDPLLPYVRRAVYRVSGREGNDLILDAPVDGTDDVRIPTGFVASVVITAYDLNGLRGNGS